MKTIKNFKRGNNVGFSGGVITFLGGSSSMMGPRGVVPVSLAVFYTLQIGEQGLIIGLIFIAVILTVFPQEYMEGFS